MFVVIINFPRSRQERMMSFRNGFPGQIKSLQSIRAL